MMNSSSRWLWSYHMPGAVKEVSQELGFLTDYPENGRPAYHPAILLKLLVYCYLNRIRSSRCFERECHRT